MLPQRFRKKPMSQINVVPYIDVMLVLLVIFMITTPLIKQGVKVELPQAGARPLEREQQRPLVLTVDVEGKLYLNMGGSPRQALDAETVVARVAAVLRSRPGTPVLVRGDARVPYARVIEAMTLLQQAGAPSVGLMTRPPEGQG